MKKIFLTSGLVLCLACPAFADDPAHYDINNDANHTLAGENAGNASCEYPTLGLYSGSQTFNAKWTANTYHITYVRNTQDAHGVGLVTQAGDTATVGGTMGTNEQQSFVYAATTALTDNDYEVAGYEFGGWQSDHILTTVAGTGTPIYENQASIKYLYPRSDATLTAIWNPVASGTITLDSSVYPSNNHTGTATYTTSTDSNDRVTAPTSTSVHTVYNTAMYAGTTGTTALENNTPSKIGYTFGGFYGKFTNDDANETQFIDATGNPTAAGKRAVNTTGGTATWYANWSVNPHTITYTCGEKPGSQNLTDGSAAPSPVNINYDGSYTLPTDAGTCEYKGWHFAGWDCNYALGTVTASTATAAYGNEYAYANGTWTNNNGTGTFKVDNNVICKAKWTANDIGLTWKAGYDAKVSEAANAADYTTGTGSCDYDGDITVGAAPYRTGYTFVGWTTKTKTEVDAMENPGFVVFPDTNPNQQ